MTARHMLEGGPATRIVGLVATIVVTVWVKKIAKRALSQAVPGSTPEAAGVSAAVRDEQDNDAGSACGNPGWRAAAYWPFAS